ncbi:MAG: hydroxyacylglutathione hydrolase [Pseudomonadota bacterium]
MSRLDVELIPAFSDNYIYLLRDGATGTVAVVDPGDATPVIERLERDGLPLDIILNTHHHADHIGGNAELVQRYGAQLIGPAADAYRIPDLDQAVSEGDTVSVGETKATVIETPGHTSGHITFWFGDDNALFCGDTLFSMGCGRLFEGTPAQMWNSLSKLRALPDAASVYCGHEYTLSNARFAAGVEPDNAEVVDRLRQIEATRAAGKPTIPADLAAEKQTNPFLRADDPRLAAALNMSDADPVDVFAEVRSRKDTA